MKYEWYLQKYQHNDRRFDSTRRADCGDYNASVGYCIRRTMVDVCGRLELCGDKFRVKCLADSEAN